MKLRDRFASWKKKALPHELGKQKVDLTLESLLASCQQLVWADSEKRQMFQANGVNITPANFYSSVPLMTDLDATFEVADGEQRPIYTDIFDKKAMERNLDQLTEFSGEFNPADEGDEESCSEFFWKNSQFNCCDALAYYCMIRRLKPRRIVEIGSGFSTLVADAAVRRNGYGEIIAIEPYPRPFMTQIKSVSNLVRKPIQEIPRNEFLGLLDEGDILFIDSTHTVKIGSDCLYIYLHLLPAITAPVTVHSHDIFLPFGMPVAWARNFQIYWTEQYLLYAYLLKNPSARVLFGSSYAYGMLPEKFQSFMGSRPIGPGGSLWYELNFPTS